MRHRIAVFNVRPVEFRTAVDVYLKLFLRHTLYTWS